MLDMCQWVLYVPEEWRARDTSDGLLSEWTYVLTTSGGEYGLVLEYGWGDYAVSYWSKDTEYAWRTPYSDVAEYTLVVWSQMCMMGTEPLV